MASRRLIFPISTLVVPTAPSRSSRLAISGRRRSHSTRATRWLVSARVTARLTTVVDLPSSGTELVTTKTFWSLSTSMYCMLVRSTRNASAQLEVPARAVLTRSRTAVGIGGDPAHDRSRR